MGIKSLLYEIAKKVISFSGYDIYFIPIPKKVNHTDRVMINVGAGNWSCDGWINLDYPSEWYKKSQKNHPFIPYDIRNDDLPYNDNSVDVIYCSHVIEHIEDKYIQKLFDECHRVLKQGGVARFTCPDAEFMYNVSKQKTEYWIWLDKNFNNYYKYNLNETKPRPVDYLVHEIATQKFISHVSTPKSAKDYINEYNDLEMYDFFDYLTKDIQFRKDHVGNHINYWTFEKMKKMMNVAGFKTILHSKYLGSVSCEMTLKSQFDITHPEMSLYVEVIKN